MTNSPLVNFVKISPNKTSPRKRLVDTITIHCVAGDATVETIGNIFAPVTRQASSNYGIGSDGRIGMYCEEKDRPWCTSSADNDHRAVTIEVSNITGAPEWGVSIAAMDSLLKLCADICRRNEIKQLLWKDDKNLAGQVNLQNMTVHRWFSNTDCPGNFLYSNMGWIADEVNKLLGTIEASRSSTSAAVTVNERLIWDFLVGKGLNLFAIAGIMGNLFAESALSSTNLQNICNKSLGMTDDVYTQSVDNGTYIDFVHDKAGYGLAQWTFWSRKQALLEFAKAAGTSIGDMTMQLNYLWKELQSYTGMMTEITKASTVREASDIILFNFERPAEQGEAIQIKRASYGQVYYNKFVAEVFEPYMIQINHPSLNVRKGPGTDTPVVKTLINDKNLYTIVEEADGSGAPKWLKLKSGLGWISQSFVKKM